MENWQYGFQAITHFSVVNVETYGPRQKGIKTLTLEIESKIPPGKYPLVLVEPFPPFGRPGKELNKLATLRAEEIERIWIFDKPEGGRWARIEICGKVSGATVFVSCDAIEGVPGWDEAPVGWRACEDE